MATVETIKRSRKRKHLFDEYKLIFLRSVHTAMRDAREAASRTWETGSSLPVARDHCTGHCDVPASHNVANKYYVPGISLSVVHW